MKRIRDIALFFSLMALIFFSCHKKDSTAPAPDLGLEYFPVKVNSWIIYDVDSTYYLDSSKSESIRYQIKELIESEFTDTTGRLTQRIERYYRMYDALVPYDQIDWTISNVCTINRTPATAERVEGTERFLKLVFPPQAGKKWNGNVFNTQDSWRYEYSNVHIPKTVVFSFDSTLMVQQSGLNDPLINVQISTETYAKHVGLVSKTYRFLKMQPDTTGSKYTMTINDYSH